MNLNKDMLEAIDKCREASDLLNKGLNVPRETSDEIKKLKDDNNCLLISSVVLGLLFGVSMMFHAKNSLDNDDSYKSLYEFERDHRVKPTSVDKMIISYNEQMVKSLEREVKSLKEDLAYEAQSAKTNKILYKACMFDK